MVAALQPYLGTVPGCSCIALAGQPRGAWLDLFRFHPAAPPQVQISIPRYSHWDFVQSGRTFLDLAASSIYLGSIGCNL